MSSQLRDFVDTAFNSLSMMNVVNMGMPRNKNASSVMPVIGVVIIRVWIVVAIRIIPVIARTKPDTEVNSSIRTRRARKGQNPGHECN
jgi:hypothetical protein